MGLIVLLFCGCAADTESPDNTSRDGHDRWYTNQQVQTGELLFIEHCASCHQRDASGTRDWQAQDANGNYPPPPLDGSAHAWHHPLTVLRMTVQRGGIPLGGQMPAFGDKLSKNETDAVIAYFQSKWSDEIYQRWVARHPEKLKNELGL